MCDALLKGISKNKAVDRFLSIVYPCSLLYAVSGIAEDRKKGDVPLLGLARHLDEGVYRGRDPLVRDTHQRLREWPASIVWSHNNTREVLSEAIFSERAGSGQFCLALKHGDFDSDSWTALSIAAILKR
jgi:hypothetical protein